VVLGCAVWVASGCPQTGVQAAVQNWELTEIDQNSVAGFGDHAFSFAKNILQSA